MELEKRATPVLEIANDMVLLAAMVFVWHPLKTVGHVRKIVLATRIPSPMSLYAVVLSVPVNRNATVALASVSPTPVNVVQVLV